MGRLGYTMGVSLDGYIEDASGSIEFSAPDEELHRFANEQAREAAAFLFGRGLFEVMEDYWTDAATRDDAPEVEAEFARAYVETPRIVFSDTLASVPEPVRLVRSADARAEVMRLKREVDGRLDLGGAGLAASLIDLIDDFGLFVNPVVVGGGKRYLPELDNKLPLRLSESRTLGSGVIWLRYERTR